MALARWQATITNDGGAIQPGAEIEVRAETAGAPLVSIFADREGAVPLGNPFTAADGHAAFHVAGGAYRITASYGASSREWRYVAIGMAAETDGVGVAWRGVWATGQNYALRDIVTEGGEAYICTSPHTSGLSTEPGSGASWATVWALLAAKGNQEIRLRAIADVSGGDAITLTDRARILDVAAGTGTIDIDPCASLGDGFWTIVKNSSAGVVTLAANGAELINGAATYALKSGESVLVQCSGAAFTAILLRSARARTIAVDHSAEWGIDAVPSSQTLAHYTPYDMAPGSGLVLLTNHVDGNVGLYLIGGGGVNLLGQTSGGGSWVANTATPAAGQITVYYSAGSGSYRIKSNYNGSPVTIGILGVRTRASI